MPISVTCNCGARFDLKDEYAGMQLQCPQCGGLMQAPPAVALDFPEGDAAFARDKFLLRQKRIAINQKYYVWDERQQNILFIERPAMIAKGCLAALAAFAAAGVVFAAFAIPAVMIERDAVSVPLFIAGGVLAFITLILVAVGLSPLRHISIYRDDTKREKLLEIKQLNRWQIPFAYYAAIDGEGKVLARFTKNFLWNMIRRRWYIYNPDGSLMSIAREDSMILSLLRRIMPDIIAVFMLTNFVIFAGDSPTVIGEFNRKFTLFDRYVLDMSADRAHLMDRRVALALGVLLDSGERR